MNNALRSIAIYLPQFHPIPENNEWWGKGFTEWTKVIKAKPLFKGHYQPHLPADLGFYDLRLSEAREAQAQLAKENGIYGFCYYHYWFNGRRILERPFQEVYESGKPDFPFMLCWANENWSRRWDGSDNEILLKQSYSLEDDLHHIQALIPYFKDKRYIKVNGRPVIAIYRSSILPDAQKTLSIWRNEAKRHNINLYICRFESCHIGGEEFLRDGFDAAIDFQPWGRQMKEFRALKTSEKFKRLDYRLANYWYRNVISLISKKPYQRFKQEVKKKIINNNVFRYDEYVEFVLNQSFPSYKVFPGITPMWDNTPRRKEGQGILLNSSPELYKKWLKHIVQNFTPFSREENFIFINAWNEWAEGNHLEPCMKYGNAYLQATKEVLRTVEKD